MSTRVTRAAKFSRAIASLSCACVLMGVAACSTAGEGAQGSSGSESAQSAVTTVARATEINASGHVSANLPSENPEILLENPQPAEDKNYERVLTLDRAGALSRMVYSLGLGDKLVGRDLASDFPAVADLPNLTPGGHSVNAEAVLKLNPQLVITDGTIGPSRVFDTLEEAGITVVRVESDRTPETIDPLVDDVAAVLGLADQAEQVKQRIDDDLASATEYAQAKADGRKMMILYVRGTGVAMIAGPDSGGRSLITRLGGVDAGEGVGITGSFTPITPEALIAAAPDTIIVMTAGLESVGGIDGLLEIPGVAQTPAGQNQSIMDVPDAQLLIFGCQTPVSIRAMADALYGES